MENTYLKSVNNNQKFGTSAPKLSASVNYTLLYFLVVTSTLSLFSILNLIVGGHTLLDNDELKFYFHGAGYIFTTAERTAIIEKDFIGYVWLLEAIHKLDNTPLLNKLLSVLFSLPLFVILKKTFSGRLALTNNQILLVLLFPTLLYYSISGVRDALFTTIYLYFILYCTKQQERDKAAYIPTILICFVAAYLIRPEGVLILLASFLTYKFLANWPSTKWNIAALTIAAVSMTLIMLHARSISILYEAYTLQGTQNSKGGLLETARSLPMPIDNIVLGTLNLMGSVPNLNYLRFDAASDFEELGVTHNHPNIVPTKLILFAGIIAQNAAFPTIIIYATQIFIKFIKFKPLAKEHALFATSFLLLFIFGKFTIEHGKSSAFYPILHVTTLAYFIKSRQKLAILSITLGFLLTIYLAYGLAKL